LFFNRIHRLVLIAVHSFRMLCLVAGTWRCRLWYKFHFDFDFDFFRLALKLNRPVEVPELSYTWSKRTRLRLGISLKKGNLKWKVSKHVLEERLEITWCNLFKVRTFIKEVFGYDPIIASLDEKGMHLNENASKNRPTLDFKDVAYVCLRENEYDSKHRWTGMTQCVSELEGDEVPGTELLFCGGEVIKKQLGETLADLRACGACVDWISVATSDSGSYRTEHFLDFLDKHLLPWSPSRKWRILMFDAAKAHLDDAVRRSAWQKGYVCIPQGGGTTSVTQVNDTDLHQYISQEYQELEMMQCIDQAEIDSFALPQRGRDACVRDWHTVWKRPSMHALAAKGFKKRGHSNKLDGTEDHLLIGTAGNLWKKLGMSDKRPLVVSDIEEGVRTGELHWTYEMVNSIIREFPHRGQLDVLYDAHEAAVPLAQGEEPHSDREDVSDDAGDVEAYALADDDAVVGIGAVVAKALVPDAMPGYEGISSITAVGDLKSYMYCVLSYPGVASSHKLARRPFCV